MAKQNRSVIVRNCLIISAVLCAIAFVLGFLKRGFEKPYYMKDKPEVVNVTRIEDITAKKDSVSNDKLVLLNDIRITDSSFGFGSGNDPFVGEFDGNGYTVVLDFEDGTSDAYSLFGCIGKGGVVKNTHFSFGSVTAASNSYAGIANVNYGTVTDCKIDFARLKMRGNDGIFSPCVAVNYGTVSNVYVSCIFDCDTVEEMENKITFGSVCSYNYGILKNSIAMPVFSGLGCVDEANILLSGGRESCKIAAVCALTASTAQTGNSAAVLGDGIYTCDKNGGGITVFASSGGLFDNSVIFNDLEFDNRIWSLSGNKLELISGGGNYAK